MLTCDHYPDPFTEGAPACGITAVSELWITHRPGSPPLLLGACELHRRGMIDACERNGARVIERTPKPLDTTSQQMATDCESQRSVVV